jgi:hypothetical protein
MENRENFEWEERNGRDNFSADSNLNKVTMTLATVYNLNLQDMRKIATL